METKEESLYFNSKPFISRIFNVVGSDEKVGVY